jgi:hypothetical protein
MNRKGEEMLTFHLMHEVYLNGKVLIVNPMLARRMKMELLEREDIIPHFRLPLDHHLDGRAQILKFNLVSGLDLHLHEVGALDGDSAVEDDGRLRLASGTFLVLRCDAVPVRGAARFAVAEVADLDHAGGVFFSAMRVGFMGAGSKCGVGVEGQKERG